MTPAKSNGSHFTIWISDEFRALGLDGTSARVALDGDTLTLVGDRSGEFRLHIDEVGRLRLCKFYTRQGTFCEALIDRTSGSRLRFGTNDKDGGYGVVMRAFAEKLGPGRVYRGDSRLNATIMLLLASASMTLLAVMLAIYAIFLGSAGFGFAAIIVGVADFFMTRSLLRRMWPKPVQRLEELESELPDVQCSRP